MNRSGNALPAALTIVAGLMACALVAGGALTALLPFVALILLATAVMGIRRPTATVAVGMAGVALIPVYWVPTLPGFQTAVLPATALCLALIPAASRSARLFRLGLTDRFLIAYVVVRVVSLLLNAPQPVGPSLAVILDVAIPYAVFRVLALRTGISAAAAWGLVVGGVMSALIAIREYNGIRNPFFRGPRGRNFSFYAVADERLGHLRPEAAFGRAVALGMFLALAVVLALALILRAKSPGTRILLVGSAITVAWGLSVVLSRGPLLMLILALVVVLIGELRNGRMTTAVVVVGGLFALAGFGALTTVFELRDASTGDERVRASGDYRLEILEVTTRADNFSWLGKPIETETARFNDAISQQTGLRSIDGAYALTYLSHGLLTLVAFVLAVVSLARPAFLFRTSLLDRAWSAAVLGVLLNMFTANLIAQFTHIFWIAGGIIAAGIQLRATAMIEEDVDDRAPVLARA